MIILWILIFFLLLIILFLCYAIVYVVKKTTYMSKKEKEFIEFSIDMYIKYGAKEIESISKEQHEVIVIELEKIRKRYFININPIENEKSKEIKTIK